jgi:hypothetical protein
MRRLGLAPSLLITLALPSAALAWRHHGFHGGFHHGFHPNNVVVIVNPQRPFFHQPHVFVRPFVSPVVIPAPVVVMPVRSQVWVPGFWRWAGWQWAWVPGHWGVS